LLHGYIHYSTVFARSLLSCFVKNAPRHASLRFALLGAGVGHVAVQVAALRGARVVAVCSSSNIPFVKSCGAASVLDYTKGAIFKKIRSEAEKNGAFDIVLDCVNSADSRDQSNSYKDTILAMGGEVVCQNNGHSYVVLGGASIEWFFAAVLRFTGLNFFRKGFELFWIKMPGAAVALERLTKLVENRSNGLRPKFSQDAFTLANVRLSFDLLRGRRTAGKLVYVMETEVEEKNKRE